MSKAQGGARMNSIYWLIVLAVLIVIEILTLGLTTIWFAGGALVSFFVSLFVDSFGLEMGVGLVVSFFLLFYTRPIVKKYLNKGIVKTNYESLIGRDGRVTEVVNNLENTGTVDLSGQLWSARATNDHVILEPDTVVTVTNIQGVKLIVEKKEEDKKCRQRSY